VFRSAHVCFFALSGVLLPAEPHFYKNAPHIGSFSARREKKVLKKL